MGIFNSIGCCISKLSNLIGASTNNFLLHLVENCTFNIFHATYNSSVEKFIITFHVSIILSTITPTLTIFPSSSFICLSSTMDLTRLLTLFVTCYLHINSYEVWDTFTIEFINVVSRSLSMTFNEFCSSFNIFRHTSKSQVTFFSFSLSKNANPTK